MLLQRTLLSDRPIQVSYALTPLGQSLAPILRALKDWVRIHYLQVAALQQAHQAEDITQGSATPGAERA